jgi:hypothetical protein
MKRMQFLFKILVFPFVVVGKILVMLFGKIDWLKPSWLAYLDNLRKQSPAKFVALSLVIIVLGGATYNVYDYYQRLPEPILVDAVITISEPSDEFDSYDEDDNNFISTICRTAYYANSISFSCAYRFNRRGGQNRY